VVTREADVVGNVLVQKGDYETMFAMTLRVGFVSANAGMGATELRRGIEGAPVTPHFGCAR